MPNTPKMTSAEAALDRALCNFCNEAGDPFEPARLWDEYQRKKFSKLCEAYNEWYKTKISGAYPQPRRASSMADEHQYPMDKWSVPYDQGKNSGYQEGYRAGIEAAIRECEMVYLAFPEKREIAAVKYAVERILVLADKPTGTT